MQKLDDEKIELDEKFDEKMKRLKNKLDQIIDSRVVDPFVMQAIHLLPKFLTTKCLRLIWHQYIVWMYHAVSSLICAVCPFSEKVDNFVRNEIVSSFCYFAVLFLSISKDEGIAVCVW